MNILDKITAHKHLEVKGKKSVLSIALLKQCGYFNRDCLSLTNALRQSNTGIIAEHKRRSPSKAIINDKNTIEEIVPGYVSAGATAVSILTDTSFFGGSLNDLIQARPLVNIPILRKDFIVDTYQIYEAKAYGADAILLIAACLSPNEIIKFSSLAKDLGLDVLIEIHNEEELEKCILETIDLIGVNNRNLKTFDVSLETSKELSQIIPKKYVKISESGIHSTDSIQELRQFGFDGFLMGEHFMKAPNPAEAATHFIKALV